MAAAGIDTIMIVDQRKRFEESRRNSSIINEWNNSLFYKHLESILASKLDMTRMEQYLSIIADNRGHRHGFQ